MDQKHRSQFSPSTLETMRLHNDINVQHLHVAPLAPPPLELGPVSESLGQTPSRSPKYPTKLANRFHLNDSRRFMYRRLFGWQIFMGWNHWIPLTFKKKMELLFFYIHISHIIYPQWKKNVNMRYGFPWVSQKPWAAHIKLSCPLASSASASSAEAWWDSVSSIEKCKRPRELWLPDEKEGRKLHGEIPRVMLAGFVRQTWHFTENMTCGWEESTWTQNDLANSLKIHPNC